MKKQKKQNTNKGITLIALVITIIVMLILVAVTITMAVNGGLFEYAGSAGRQTNEAIANEQQLANLEENMTVDELIDKYTQESEEEPTEVSIGDYVNYPVTYTNVATSVSGVGYEYNYPMDNYTGWRVLSKETDEAGNEYVRLVSAGVPLSYHHYNDAALSVTNLTTNFLATEIDTASITQYKFYGCGFDLGDEVNNLSGVFANQYTDKVQAMTKEDIDGLLGEVLPTNYDLSILVSDLLLIPMTDEYIEPSGFIGTDYCSYWLASSVITDYYLALVDGYGFLKARSGIPVFGIRPVVTLLPTVQFSLATQETNETTTWNISIQ